MLETDKDVVKKCRCCMGNGMFNILSTKHDNLVIAEIVEVFTATQILPDDNFPKFICQGCLNLVISFHNFLINFYKVQKLLSGIVENEIDFEEIQTTNTRDEEVQEEVVVKIENTDEWSSVICDTSSIENQTESENHAQETVEFQCEFCKESFWEEGKHTCKNKEKEGKSEANRRKKGSYKCGDCSEVYEYKNRLSVHCKETGHDYPFNTCKICSMKLSDFRSLKIHERRHESDKPYKCGECGMAFKIRSYLKMHLVSHSGERSFLCEYCGKAFIHRTAIKEHISLHTGVLAHICEICGKSFRSKRFLCRHVRQKHGPKTEHSKKSLPKRTTNKGPSEIVKCKLCEKTLTKHGLYQHMKIQHGDGTKKFKCTVCDKAFFYKTSLDIHLASHSKTKTHKCEECGKSFGQKAGLKDHIRIHTGEKPFVCNFCNKGFSQRSHLAYHLTTHTGEKPFECSSCQKKFATRGNLRMHEKIHVRRQLSEENAKEDSTSDLENEQGVFKVESYNSDD